MMKQSAYFWTNILLCLIQMVFHLFGELADLLLTKLLYNIMNDTTINIKFNIIHNERDGLYNAYESDGLIPAESSSPSPSPSPTERASNTYGRTVILMFSCLREKKKHYYFWIFILLLLLSLRFLKCL